MPCATQGADRCRPRTSPDPAVANHGASLMAMAARPFGSATTVSAPLSTTTAPLAAAAARVRALRLRLIEVERPAEQPGELAIVRGEDDGMATRGDEGEERIRRLGEADERVGVEDDRAWRRVGRARRPARRRPSAHVASPTPRPGPSATALLRLSASRPESASAPSTTLVMIAVSAVACTSSAAAGVATGVTRPAPARKAPRAQSRAAPVCATGPERTTAWPRAYLWPARLGTGSACRHSAGAFSIVRGRISSSTAGSMPMSARRSAPHWTRPGSRR